MAKSSPSAFEPADPRASTPLQAQLLDEPDPPLALGNLWQMPLLLVSLALFTLAAYLFIDPRPAPSFQAQLARAQRDISAERYDAAVGRLNDLLALQPESREESLVRLGLAEALDGQIRRNRRVETPQIHRRIVTEITLAYAAGAMPTPASADRLARSHEALEEIDEAAGSYRRAVDLLERNDQPEQAVPMRRSAIDMLIAHDRQVAAADDLRAFLDVPGLSSDERAWALGELARVSIDSDRPGEARRFLEAALALAPDEAIEGQVNFHLGYAAWKLGEDLEAEKRLKLAREQLGPGHVLDAEACLLLGRLAQAREAPAEAGAYYEIVLQEHPGSRSAPRARLGRGLVRILQGQDQQGVADLVTLADEIQQKPVLTALRAEMLDALQRGSRILASRDRYDQALELLACEQRVDPEPQPDFFARLGLYHEKLADELDEAALAAEDAQRPAIQNRARTLRTRAGDAYVAYSRRLVAIGDGAYPQALWKGIALYERAANLPEAVATLELFCSELPDDPIAPDAMLRLGRAYAAVGRQDQAVDTYRRLRDRHPQSLAAAEAGVPLAQWYIALGEENYPEAESVLRSVIENNPVLAPDSQAFRQAVWELGHLHYRTGRYGEALARLEEFSRRYEAGERAAQLAFLKGDCHRLAAAQKIAESRRPADPLKPDEPSLAAEVSRITSDPEARGYLEQARAMFDHAISIYAKNTPTSELDTTYERLAWFYRADCLFDLGLFEDAIRLYDAAAYRYQEHPATLAASVQIVNAYSALGRVEEAKVANERAKWLLKRIPPEAFVDGRLSMPRDYWEQWLKWAGESGVW